MKIFLMTLFFILPLFAGENCPLDLEESPYCGELQWVDGPHLDRKSHFIVRLWLKTDAERSPVEPKGQVKIFSWMTMANGHNHGGPKFTVERPEVGVYEVKDARFFMGGMQGHWDVKVTLESMASSLVSFN